MDLKKLINKAAGLIKGGKNFLLSTHKDPDTDAIGSMLALARAIDKSGKQAAALTEKPLLPPLNLLKGSEKVVQKIT